MQIDTASFTPWSALLGGALLGMSAALFLLFTGRIAGISGVIGGLLKPTPGDFTWRITFLAGLIAGGVAAGLWAPAQVTWDAPRSLPVLVVAGLLVGIGTRLGSGCTSGHGVCGVSRLSRRSLVATGTFMLVGMASASLTAVLLGGGP